LKIIFLGTNGWYTSDTGNTACILIDSKDNYVILDAGNGLYKIDKYIKENKPISLFISHFHLDHVSGFHTLAKFDFKQGINVYVAKSRKKDFEFLVNPPYTIGIDNNPTNIGQLRTKVKVYELTEGNHNIGFPITISKLYHAYNGHGYKITLDKKNIVYSGDTKVGDNSLSLANKADLLIHECTNIRSQENDVWGHTDPEQAANLAKQANVKKLVLTHFQPNLYDSQEKRKTAEIKARKVFINTIAATDDLILKL